MNIALHRRVLLRLLQKIFSHPLLARHCGFKGGTSLYFLESLQRFSVDLDFNLLERKTPFPRKEIERILATELRLSDLHKKRYSWLYEGTYEPGQWSVKVEFCKRLFPDEYEQRSLYGLSVPMLALPYQLSHKLCAITDRAVLANRDIFDTHFMLSKHVSIIAPIIEQRTGKSVDAYLASLLTFIPNNISRRDILDGLGELLDAEKKKWVRQSLIKETLFLIESRIAELNQ